MYVRITTGRIERSVTPRLTLLIRKPSRC